jgi:hypothetical protein
MTVEREFLSNLRGDLELRGLLGNAASRTACAERANAEGRQTIALIERMMGTKQAHRALASSGQHDVGSFTYIAGYGALMTEFLIAPLPLEPAACAEVAKLGALANVIVSFFDQMVDGGRRRSLLLPAWALGAAATPTGRVLLRLLARLAPVESHLTLGLVAEYFRRLSALPHAARHRCVRADVVHCIAQMYREEGRTPREWERIRGSAALQKKTALPLVVLGLPGWLGAPRVDGTEYARHRRWLVRLGKFVRWIDDAADATADAATNGPNLVVRTLGRRGRPAEADGALAAMVAERGRWILEEWRSMMASAGRAESGASDVIPAVLVSWLGAPEAIA